MSDSKNLPAKKVYLYHLPVGITGDRSEGKPVTLTAEVFKFPYTINGIEGSTEKAIRLMPEAGGKIEKVKLNESSHQIKIIEMTTTPKDMLMEYEGGVIKQAEVIFSHQENLLPMKPSKGFKKNVVEPRFDVFPRSSGSCGGGVVG